MLNIEGLNKAEVLAALYNNSQPLGLGILHYDPKDMTIEEANEMLSKGVTDFDYLKGRVMKINLRDDKCFEERLYDRDNGEGAAERAIKHLRK